MFEKALNLSQIIKDKSLEADVSRDYGYANWQQGDFHTAKTRYQGALALYQELYDQVGETEILNRLGVLSIDRYEFSWVDGKVNIRHI